MKLWTPPATWTVARRSGLAIGRLRRRTASINWKIPAFTPIPSAKVKIAVMVKPGLFRRERNATFRSWTIESDHLLPAVRCEALFDADSRADNDGFFSGLAISSK